MRELFLIESKTVIRYADVGISQLQETLESSAGLFWLDIEQMTDEDAAFFSEFKECRFHPLSIAECRSAEGRPKIIEFPEYLLLVLYGLDDYTQGVTASMTKICLFLTPDFLVTVHSTPLPFLQQVKDRIEQDYLMMRTPGYCMAMILGAIVAHMDSMIPQLDANLTSFETEIPDQEDIRRLNEEKRDAAALRRVISLQRDIMNELITHAYPQMQPETINQVRDMYHRLAHITDILEHYGETLADLRAGALAGVSSRLHATVRRLTTVATVFLPLICLASLFGMDSNFMGFSPGVGYAIALASLTVIAVILALVSRQR